MREPSTVGIDVGGTKLLIVAECPGRDGPLVRRVPTGPAAGPWDIETAYREFVGDFGLAPAAVGVAVPGLVGDGRVVVSDVLPKLDGWRGLADGDVPHVLVNDIRGALAEESSGPAGTSTVAVMLAGTAVGSAYLHQGRVVRGSRGWAGEIGSMPVPTPHGIQRLDELAGGAAIVRATGMEPRRIHDALAAGDTAVRDVVHASGEAFGLAVAALVNILNPDAVRIAGGTLGYAGYWEAALATARTHSLPPLWNACAVERIRNPELVVARGAMRLASAHDTAWARQFV